MYSQLTWRKKNSSHRSHEFHCPLPQDLNTGNNNIVVLQESALQKARSRMKNLLMHAPTYQAKENSRRASCLIPQSINYSCFATARVSSQGNNSYFPTLETQQSVGFIHFRGVLNDYQYTVQRYCSIVQPTLSPSEKRHTQPDTADAVLHQWHNSSGQLQQQRKGVNHLHTWRATGHH